MGATFVSNQKSMIKKIITKKLAVIGIISAIALSGCGLTVSHSPNHYNNGRYNNYRSEYQLRIDNNDRRIAQLRTSGYRDDVFVIETRNNDMKKKLNEFNGNSEQEWKAFKTGFNVEVRGVEKSLKNFPKGNKKRK